MGVTFLAVYIQRCGLGILHTVTAYLDSVAESSSTCFLLHKGGLYDPPLGITIGGFHLNHRSVIFLARTATS